MKYIVTLLIAFYVLLSVWASAGATGIRYPDVPRGCVIVGITSPEDEGFPIALCRNGRYIYADMDGDGRDPKSNGRWRDASGYVSYGIHPGK